MLKNLLYPFFFIDTDLNKNGRDQAKRCGKRLKDDHFDHVYCSDLSRCKQVSC